MMQSSELTQADDPLPQQIGRYRIVACLGAGGMGTVYKALDPHLDRSVAVKLPRFDGPQPDRLRRVQRFQREARTAARIWHPHVCPIYDVGEHDGQPFVVMPFVEGQSLAQRLATQGRYEDVSEAIAIILQILDALGAVHRGGVVHRDLKDGNILLDPEGRAVLTDFGLARPENDAEHLTSDGVIVGTPSFMAPEVVAGQSEQVGPWTDLYSLGIVLYRMVTGKLPFEGPALTVLSKIAHEDPVPPSKWRHDLDPALEAVVLKAMAREPGRRYQSAGEFAAALQGWCVTKSVDATQAQHAIRIASSMPASTGAKSLTLAASEPTPGSKGQKLRWLVPLGCLLNLLFFGGGLLVLALLLNQGRPTTSALTRSAPPVQNGVEGKAAADPATLIEEAEKGHLVRVQRLLRQGTDCNAKDQLGQTALMKAAAKGHVEVVAALLNQGGTILEVNEIDDKGETALMKAAENGHEDVVLILAHHQSIALNLKDEKGQSALDKAKAKKYVKIIEQLKMKGAKE